MRNANKVMEDLSGKFWTRQNEMADELESLDYEVIELGWNRIVVVDCMDEEEQEYELEIGHANKTMWIKDVHCE